MHLSRNLKEKLKTCEKDTLFLTEGSGSSGVLSPKFHWVGTCKLEGTWISSFVSSSLMSQQRLFAFRQGRNSSLHSSGARGSRSQWLG